MRKNLLLLVGLAAVAPVRDTPAWGPGVRGPAASDSTIVIYLVRHAEKLDESADPPLNDVGTRRAEVLADLLRDAGISAIWSTAYRRTLATVAPLASSLGLEVRRYDPIDLDAFAATLLRTPGRYLVVGHSNTTPDLVRALGGDPHGTIEGWEYDRLYAIVARPGGGTPSTTLLRFGDRSRP